MSQTYEFEGQSEDEAVAKACAALSVEKTDLDFTLLDEGSSGVFGLGSRPVRIRVRGPEGIEIEAPAAVAENDETAEGEADSGDKPRESKDAVGPAPEKAAEAVEVAQGLAERMGIEAEVSVRDEEREIVVVINEIEGKTDVADILGKSRPPAIPSFQFLLNKIVNRFPEGRKHIVVEVPSVPRKERRQVKVGEPKAGAELDPDLDPALVAMGQELARKAVELNKVITVHPMLPGDRRALHQTLMVVEGAHTVSEGEGLYRRLHVVPDTLKTGGKKRRRRRRRRRRSEDGETSESTEAVASSEPEEPAVVEDAEA